MAGELQGGSSMKRKPPDSISFHERAASKRASKRAKLAEHGEKTVAGFDSEAPRDLAYHLPAEIWHRVFTFVPPKTLGRLLTVNKLFRTYLDPSSTAEVKGSTAPSHKLMLMKPDAIWQASRRSFWPHMPGPLKDKSEIDMWRFCCSRTCQFCNLRDRSVVGKTQDHWTRGPGAKGVSPVFPFFIVSCGKCLSDNIVKEVDVFLSSSTPSFLLAGLPMVFLTPELHVIPPQVLASGIGPLQTQITKAFDSTQLENINAEFEAVKALGYAAAEEWSKGLEDRGKRSLADASRWERWYLSGGVYDMRTSRQSLQAPASKDATAFIEPLRNILEAVHTAEQIGQNPSSSVRADAGDNDLMSVSVEATNLHPGPRARRPGQQKITKTEAHEHKAKRKAEIERRALLLETPMTPAVLVHAPSFQAAVQITTPLDDKAWEILKPRLLDQREAAEKRERESSANAIASQAIAKAAQPRSTAIEPQSEVADKDWDEAQGPLRAKMSELADELIRDAWNDGKDVSKKTASHFALDVLLHVRSKFYGDVSERAEEARAAGREPITDPPGGPWTQKLTLENMKWIFDTKIKPHTHRYRKELFFCSACDGGRKAFGLESGIQHYAAKHTTVLSRGNVVVQWRAEWPEFKMFNSEPKPKRLQQPNGSGNAPSVRCPPSNGFQNFSPLPSADYPSYATTHQPYNRATQAANALPNPFAAEVAPLPGHTATNESQQYPSHTPAYPLHPQTLGYGASCQPRQQDTGHAEGPGKLYLNAPHQTQPAVPAANNIGQHADWLTFMIGIAEETWTKISHVTNLPPPAKALVFIHHFTTKFEQRFCRVTPFDVFSEALSNRKVVDSACRLKNLRCKSCVLDERVSSKGRTFHGLVQHYAAKHNEQPETGRLKDWRVDMIYAPDMETLPKLPTLRKGFGNHKESMALVAAALPQVFTGEPSSGTIVKRQQRPRRETSTQEKAQAREGSNRRDSSSSDSYEPELNPEDVIAKLECPGSQKGTAAIAAANVNAGLNNPATLDIADRPMLQPASVVYGGPDSPRQSHASFQRDGHRTQRTTQPVGRPEIMENRRATAARVKPAQPQHSGFKVPDRLETLPDSQRGVSARHTAAARETQRDLGPWEYPPRDHQAARNGYAVATEYPADRYYEPAPHMLVSSDPHDWYEGRDPRLAQHPAFYRQREEHVAYRSHPDDLPARPAQAAEPYEIVEVRDPRGNYLIKLPIRRDSGPFYSHETRGMDPSYRHGPAYLHEPQVRPVPVYEDYRQPAAAHAPQRPPSSMDYEEYDPRNPASGGGNAGSAPRDPRLHAGSQQF